VRAGHLKPSGKPAQNARKWFATVEIEPMRCDPAWPEKAVRIVEKQIQEMNRKQRGKGGEFPRSIDVGPQILRRESCKNTFCSPYLFVPAAKGFLYVVPC